MGRKRQCSRRALVRSIISKWRRDNAWASLQAGARKGAPLWTFCSHHEIVPPSLRGGARRHFRRYAECAMSELWDPPSSCGSGSSAARPGSPPRCCAPARDDIRAGALRGVVLDRRAAAAQRLAVTSHLLGIQRVASGAHGADNVRQVTIVQCLTQAADMHIHCAWFDVDVLAPDRVQQLLAREDALGV